MGVLPICVIAALTGVDALLVQVSRMEAGDHWVVYGHVLDGELQSDTELTAVMHRKAGNHY